MRSILLSLLVIILALSTAQAQEDTLFLNNGDTILCEITGINFDKDVTCIIKQGENMGETVKFRQYEIESIWTTKSFQQLAYETQPGYQLASGGHQLRSAAVLNLVSTVSVLGGSILLNNSNDPALPAVMMGAGVVMGITSVIMQISAGNSIKKSGLLMNRLKIGSTAEGVGVRISF